MAGDGPPNLKPKVSFNRDVHIKRIGPRGSSKIVPALTAINQSDLAVLPVRREKLTHLTHKQLAAEAAKVLKQADNIQCVNTSNPEKFYSLPSRKNKNRAPLRRGSIENIPPEKPPRQRTLSPIRLKRTSSDVASDKKPNVTRSRSDVGRVPLSPIIEASPTVEIDDYFKMHSSQKPVDRLPLTKGHTVDHMVKRLSTERYSSPPTPQTVLVTPSSKLKHNNNQPFSYTPQLIYSQVVCGNELDSDEGIEIIRGRADGMDETKLTTDLYDLSSRRELLESRINSRMKRTHPELHEDFTKNNKTSDNSEDEGFQSSLLIGPSPIETKRTEYYSERTEHRRNVYEYQRPPVDEVDRKEKFIGRERSIDDGSHFDPMIDKMEEKQVPLSTKPPTKAAGRSKLDKVKNLFSSKKMKERRAAKAAEKEVRARYVEYKGSQENLDEKTQEVDYSKRKKLTTPRASPIPSKPRPTKSESSWFKSIDRLTNKKKPQPLQPPPQQKNLRFFGDTTDSEGGERPPPSKPLRHHHHHPKLNDHNEISTDSSQQSQRSVVYLHAATVGDIPTPYRRDGSSIISSSPQVKTLSRSFSVLAPWTPRHYRNEVTHDYSSSHRSKENYRPNNKSTTLNRNYKKKSSKSMDSLGGANGGGGDKSAVGRSVSMPRGDKQAGWFAAKK